MDYMKSMRKSILNRMKIAIDIYNSIKPKIVLHVILVDDDTNRTGSFLVRLENESLYKETDSIEYLRSQTQLLVAESEEFYYDKYKMRIKKIVGLDININTFNKIKGGSHIKLPERMKRNED